MGSKQYAIITVDKVLNLSPGLCWSPLEGRGLLLTSTMFVSRNITSYNQEYNQEYNKTLIALNDLIILSLNVL